MNKHAYNAAIASLEMIAEHPEWPGGMPSVIAKNALDQIEIISRPPPKLTLEEEFDRILGEGRN